MSILVNFEPIEYAPLNLERVLSIETEKEMLPDLAHYKNVNIIDTDGGVLVLAYESDMRRLIADMVLNNSYDELVHSYVGEGEDQEQFESRIEDVAQGVSEDYLHGMKAENILYFIN